MVTFRNNNGRRGALDEMIEALNLMEKEINLITLFLVMKLFRENHQEEIIIMHLN